MRIRLVVVGLFGGFALLAGGEVTRAASNPACTTSAGVTTCSFAYSGAAVDWTVPWWVTRAVFTVDGAAGGAADPAAGGQAAGGNGGEVTATLPLTPGELVSISVGGKGGDSPGGSGGFNGGGESFGGGGGGGGYSAVTVGSTLELLAGGGGGGGASSDVAAGGVGGAGGEQGTNGADGASVADVLDTSVDGGGGGGQAGGLGGLGGAAGTFSGTPVCILAYVTAGFDASGSQGGDAAEGGGGAGGYTGGGGGGTGESSCSTAGSGGGGGGSSFAAADAGNAGFTTGARSGSGQVTISYSACMPTGFYRDGTDLTAAQIGGDVSGTLDATGCNIGVYYGPGSSGTVNAAEIYGANYFGVVANAATVDVTNSSIHNIGENPFNGAQHGVGIFYTTVNQNGSSTGSSATGTVSGNIVDNYQKGGVAVSGVGAVVTVASNTVTGLGMIDFIAQNGVQISYGATALVKDNTVSENWYTPKTWVACGLLFYQAGGVKQQGNNLFDNEIDLCNVGRGGGSFNVS